MAIGGGCNAADTFRTHMVRRDFTENPLCEVTNLTQHAHDRNKTLAKSKMCDRFFPRKSKKPLSVTDRTLLSSLWIALVNCSAYRAQQLRQRVQCPRSLSPRTFGTSFDSRCCRFSLFQRKSAARLFKRPRRILPCSTARGPHSSLVTPITLTPRSCGTQEMMRKTCVKVLRDLGYQTFCYTNINTRVQFRSIVQDFAEKLSANSVSLVYYAGHAVQISGENYIIPLRMQSCRLKVPPSNSRSASDMS